MKSVELYMCFCEVMYLTKLFFHLFYALFDDVYAQAVHELFRRIAGDASLRLTCLCSTDDSVGYCVTFNCDRSLYFYLH